MAEARVEQALNNEQRHEVLRFLNERHTERFFNPIRYLRQAPHAETGFGFAVMALCCLLVETIECYREGLPASDKKDFKSLKKSMEAKGIPHEYDVAVKNLPGSAKIFEKFFQRSEHQEFFSGVDSQAFYTNIRCGLLHQAQTKEEWRIVKHGKFWDPTSKQIGREEFSERLEECFSAYLRELKSENEWNSELWKNARRKNWWFVQIS